MCVFVVKKLVFFFLSAHICLFRVPIDFTCDLKNLTNKNDVNIYTTLWNILASINHYLKKTPNFILKGAKQLYYL